MTTNNLQSPDFIRLQEIEQHIVSSLDAAAEVIEELSRAADGDKEKIQKQAQDFLQHIQEAQKLVSEAVKKSVGEKDVATSLFQAVARANVAAAKVDVIQQHLQAIKAAAQQE